MLSFARLAALAFVALALAGCGAYRPLYGSAGGGGNVVATLAAMDVQEQHDRAGQLVRNELLDGVASGPQRYKLSLATSEAVIGVASMATGTASRSRYNLRAHYELYDSRDNHLLTSGDTFANAEFDTLKIPVADIQAQSDARSRAAKELGQDIRLRLAAYLSAHQG